MKEALRLHDMDIPVMLGNLDESDTFENAGIADAEMVVVRMTIFETQISLGQEMHLRI